MKNLIVLALSVVSLNLVSAADTTNAPKVVSTATITVAAPKGKLVTVEAHGNSTTVSNHVVTLVPTNGEAVIVSTETNGMVRVIHEYRAARTRKY